MMDPKVNHGYLDVDQLSESMISMNIQGMSLEVSSYSYSRSSFRSSSKFNFREQKLISRKKIVTCTQPRAPWVWRQQLIRNQMKTLGQLARWSTTGKQTTLRHRLGWCCCIHRRRRFWWRSATHKQAKAPVSPFISLAILTGTSHRYSALVVYPAADHLWLNNLRELETGHFHLNYSDSL